MQVVVVVVTTGDTRCHSCHPTNSVKVLMGEGITIHGLAHPKLSWGYSNLVSDQQMLLFTLGKGCQAPCQPSNAITPNKWCNK